MSTPNSRKLIIDTLAEKASLKYDLSVKMKNVFDQLKEILKLTAQEIQTEISKKDKRLSIEFKEKGAFEAELRFADDVLIFILHPDIFDFDKSHPIWKSSYVSEKHNRSLCGMISIFNFLSSSLIYKRENDLGYRIGRIFINNENHFFVEGRRQLGYLYNNFSHSVIDAEHIKAIIESSILYCLDFDLLVPPYGVSDEVGVGEMLAASNIMNIQTGKRLGFKLKSEYDPNIGT